MKKLTNYFIVFLLIVVNSCSDDESKKSEVIIDGKSFPLSKANIYLVDESAGCYSVSCSGNTHTLRTYTITDGTYTGNYNSCYNWLLDNSCYTNASYILIINLFSPISSEFIEGNYVEDFYWDDMNPTERYSYLDFYGVIDGVYNIGTKELGAFTTSLQLKGGAENGEAITLSYLGELQDFPDVGSPTIYDVKLYFRGKIVNKIPL